MSALLIAMGAHPTQMQAILDGATVFPFVVKVWMVKDGNSYSVAQVQECRSVADIDEAALVPFGYRLTGCSHMPVEALHRMDILRRPFHVSEYEAYLRWRRAKSLGKKPADLSLADIDPVALDEDVQRWLKPGIRYYSGD